MDSCTLHCTLYSHVPEAQSKLLDDLRGMKQFINLLLCRLKNVLRNHSPLMFVCGLDILLAEASTGQQSLKVKTTIPKDIPIYTDPDLGVDQWYWVMQYGTVQSYLCLLMSWEVIRLSSCCCFGLYPRYISIDDLLITYIGLGKLG